MTLDIGCGSRKTEPDSIGIDISPDSAADHVWDLDRYPWPLEDDRFSRIHMSHVIEHLDDPMRAMAEVYRVAADGADVFVTTPHFSSHNSYTDPTHLVHLGFHSFDYFTQGSFENFTYNAGGFRILDRHLTFGHNILLDNLGRFIAWISVDFYEKHFAWIFPARNIHCRLAVVK